MEPKRKIIGPLELGVLVIALGLIAYILLKSSGGNVYERSEKTQIVDNPSVEERKKQIRNYEMQDDDRVEVILQQLSEHYTDNTPAPVESINEEKAISEDEMNFFEDVKKRKAQDTNTISPSDWLAILQTSHKTYKKIKSVFEDADASGKPVKEDNVSRLLQNELVANTVYSRIEELFGIPEAEVKNFADQGKKAVSDWAEFVEENESKKGQ